MGAYVKKGLDMEKKVSEEGCPTGRGKR